MKVLFWSSDRTRIQQKLQRKWETYIQSLKAQSSSGMEKRYFLISLKLMLDKYLIADKNQIHAIVWKIILIFQWKSRFASVTRLSPVASKKHFKLYLTIKIFNFSICKMSWILKNTLILHYTFSKKWWYQNQ